HGLYDDASAAPALARARALALARCATPPASGFYLAATDDCLALHRGQQSGAVSADFCSADIRRRAAAGKRALLPRALGLHRSGSAHILDTTCGLGRDSAVLGALGCTVTALERHPALYALLADARHRLLANTPAWWHGRWAALHHADAADWLRHTAADAAVADVIYIDPMFDSPRRKARAQQALHWLHELLGADTDAAAVLALARRRARRVVVKAHARAAPLAPPDHQVAGKATR